MTSETVFAVFYFRQQKVMLANKLHKTTVKDLPKETKKIGKFRTWWLMTKPVVIGNLSPFTLASPCWLPDDVCLAPGITEAACIVVFN